MKKMLKQKFEAIIRMVLVATILFTSFGYSTSVFANTPQKGDVKNEENTVGSTTNAGDVELKKTVKKTDEEGIYDVTLTAKGKDIITTQSQTAPIYTVVVLDNSGSMDNCFLCIFEENKYDSAKKGAKAFAKKLIESYSSANLALVTFSTGARITRGFENKNFDDVKFPSPDGATYLADGINKATELLEAVKKENSEAKLYMVVLTDGYPEEYNISISQAAEKAKTAGTNAKNAGIEIFTIGYGTDNNTGALLQEIATDSSHFVTSDESNIVDVFTNIAGDIEVTVPAGTNAVITDVIADGFTYVEGSADPDTATVNGQTISFDVGTLTEEGTTVSFKIKIDKDLETGWHRTNDSASISYDESDEPKTITDSSEVYWVQQEYDYTINYYQDSLDGTKLGSVTGKAVKDAQIATSDVEINKFKPSTGYQDGVIVTEMPYVIIDGENVINVVYSKKTDLSYTVEYYKDEEKISNDSENTVTGQTFGNKITEDEINKNKYKPLLGYTDGTIETDMPYTIIDGENIIKVCYVKRTDMSYTVEYLEKDTEKELLDSEVRTGKTYEETYIETAKTAPYGYKLVGESTQEVKVDAENKVVKFYYEKRNDFSYKVNYLEEGTNNVLSEQVTRDNKTYNESYTETAKEISGYNVVGNNTQNFVLTEDGMEITFYYTKKTDLSYTVNYYQDSLDGKLLGTITIEEKTFEEEVTADEIDVNAFRPNGYKDGIIATDMPYTIIDGENVINVVYSIKDNLTYRVEYYYDGEIDSSKTEYFENVTFGTVITNYKDKLPEGYKFVSDNAPLTIEDSQDNVIRVYYETVPQGDITPPNTGINSTNYLPLIYLAGALIVAISRRKQEN